MGERRSTQPAKRGEWPRPAEGEGARTARLQPSRSLNCLWLLARGGPYVPRPRLVRVADAEEGAVVLRRRHETDPIFCEAGRRRGARGFPPRIPTLRRPETTEVEKSEFARWQQPDNRCMSWRQP